MKLPPDVQFHEDVRLLVWKRHTVVSEAALKRITQLIGDLEATSDKPFNRFTDTQALEAIDLNFGYVFDFSLFRRPSYAGRSPVKSAILVPSIALAHYSKMHELLTRHSSIEVRIFEEREATAKWLGVPVELLTISSIGS
ncbi:MAG: hypothetical protein Udaeo2_34500 [Candidatus Udaeobacter sp.]|nr:MAG: hypothetical protein Udaeo2_34500 [Candidatus Udaeobacter sp.]